MAAGVWGTRFRALSAYPGLLAFIAGACSVLGFAPFGLYPLPLLALMSLFWLWRDATPAAAWRSGWLFGAGLMGCGVFWLRISIHQFGGVDTSLTVIITLGFVALMALYFGLAGWIGCRLTPNPTARLLLTFPAAWGLMEWLRGWVLSGFPWLAFGYSQVDSPLGGYAPLLGVYGVSWVLALSAGLLLASVSVGAASSRDHVGAAFSRDPAQIAAKGRSHALAQAALAALLWGGGAMLTGHPWSLPLGVPFEVSLVQPSIPQTLKWDPARRGPTLEIYRRLTRTQAAHSALVIWPETAVPDFLHRVEDSWLQPLAQELAERGAHLLIGVPILDPAGEQYYNGAVVVGSPDAVYYKRHLVPFGEFLPLERWLGPLLDFLQIPMSHFSAGQAARPTLRIGKQTVGVSICYEDAFGEEVREALPEASYLVNLSNDAWFGDSLAPHQHLEMARMRALETGRPLLRATNSGISALIGPHGEVQAATRAFTETVLTGPVQPMTGVTPFVRWGNGAAVTLMLLGLAGGTLKSRSKIHFDSISY